MKVSTLSLIFEVIEIPPVRKLIKTKYAVYQQKYVEL